jgi:hypothetical protein
MGPYGSIRDWSLLAWADMTISRLDVVDLKTGGPPRRLFADAPDYGYLPGPYSPSGDQMAVTRVRGHDRELEDRRSGPGPAQATWTGLNPVARAISAAPMQWRSEAHELIAVAQDPQAIHPASRQSTAGRRSGPSSGSDQWRATGEGRARRHGDRQRQAIWAVNAPHGLAQAGQSINGGHRSGPRCLTRG